MLSGDGVVAVPLGEPDGLACPITQIIELGPPGLAASNRLYIEYIGRIQRKDSFDALVTDHSPDREVFIYAPSFACNDRAGKYLRPLFFTLFNTAVNLDDIAYLKVRDLVLETLALNGV
jgi:hypothetical protein